MISSGLVLPNLLAARVSEDPQRPLIREIGGRELSYGETWQEVLRWAGGLRALGVGPGDPVLVMLPTSASAYTVWLGAAVLHAVEVPINPQHRGGLLDHLIADSGARVVVAERSALDSLERLEGLHAVDTIVLLGDDPRERIGGARVVHADALLRDSPPLTEWDAVEPWETAAVLYTSGTTGPSKGVVIPWAQAHATAMGNGPDRALRTPETVIFQPYPTFHVSGKYAIYNAALGRGQIVVRSKLDVSRFWDDIRDYGCTHCILMGTTAGILLRNAPAPDDADNPLTSVLFSPWTSEVEDFKSRFGCEAFSVFNMTEVSCPIVAGWDGGPVGKPASCGRAREGYTLRIVDEYDRPVPTGEAGELILRADRPWTLMAGYWRRPDATVAAWRNQWFHTGDLFRIDEDGDLYYLDRTKDAIRRRGENISSAEVEAEVLAHPAVLEVAAVAVDDLLSEQEIKVVVVEHPERSVDPIALTAFLRDRMAAHMMPRYLEIVAELPKTPTGKVRKNVLRESGVSDATVDLRPPAGGRLAASAHVKGEK